MTHLEGHVFEEVSCAVVLGVLESRTGINPHSNGGRVEVGVGFGSNSQPIGKLGNLSVFRDAGERCVSSVTQNDRCKLFSCSSYLGLGKSSKAGAVVDVQREVGGGDESFLSKSTARRAERLLQGARDRAHELCRG